MRPEMQQKRRFAQEFFRSVGFTMIELTFEQALGVLALSAGKTAVED